MIQSDLDFTHMEAMTILSSIHHSGSSRYVLPNLPSIGDQVRIRLRASLDAPIQQVILRTCPDGEQQLTPMQPEQDGKVCRWWATSVSIHMPVTHYRFLLITSDGIFWYNGSGLHDYNPTDAEDFRILADYEAPSWVRESVFYQIFPDRFAVGDPSHRVQDGEYEYGGFRARARAWGEPPITGSRAAMVEFYGGDLRGITEHLDYIASLGVNALYLNPVFTALSNHRYDVIDYFSVDPHLGGDASLVELRRALDRRGMRYLLDIVPNHCGVLHPWFQTAQADPIAPTAEYLPSVGTRMNTRHGWACAPSSS
jgi:alpha-glucosidase